MNNVQDTNTTEAIRRARRIEQERLRRRLARAKDLASQVRERAEAAMRERPYLLPVATGAAGIGIGLLLGSKLTRYLLLAAAGTLLSETFGGELRRLSRTFIHELEANLDASGEDDVEPSIAE